MKNKILFFAFLFLNFYTFAQTGNVVKWSDVSIVRMDSLQYKLSFSGAIQKDWHLYAEDKQDQITGPLVLVSNNNIKLGKLTLLSSLQSYSDPIYENKIKQIFSDSIHLEQFITLDSIRNQIEVRINYFAGKPDNFLEIQDTFYVAFKSKESLNAQSRVLIPSIDIHHPVINFGGTPKADKHSFWGIFFIGFLAGLLALITPCVFPMIPLTVSFFTKRAPSRKQGIRNALIYGFFIFLIYILLSLPFHFLSNINPEILNNISTNVYVNVAFFIIFIFFALSFFGLYEITLPAALSTGADSKSGLGNIIGIFFMALTLAVVSFSCTGPILGSLLAGSLASNGGAMQLTMGMAGFGLALALPFALLAIFPNWLQSLPKSGGWLNTVKVVLGFLEFGLAFKFLSNADLVEHWGILKREIFIGIWVLVGIGTSLYLFGKIKFPHDTPVDRLSVSRKILAVLFFAFALYLMPGLTNTKYANLKLISGFPPPLYNSIYKKKSDCILNLNCTKDYEQGLEIARREKKPLLIDFTGYACVNCRRMEENVWSDPDVHAYLLVHYVVASLYVDDKKKLPVSKQFFYQSQEGVKKEIVSYGDLWSTFETENFANNAQPLYAIINNEEILLTNPVGYTPDKTEYLDWLKKGVEAFEKKVQ